MIDLSLTERELSVLLEALTARTNQHVDAAELAQRESRDIDKNGPDWPKIAVLDKRALDQASLAGETRALIDRVKRAGLMSITQL